MPQVLDAIEALLNREGVRPGIAVLTGSTRQDAVARSARALTGRIHSFAVLPVSQGESEGGREDRLPALPADPVAAVGAHPTSSTTRVDHERRIAAGGFPLALRRSGASRNRWFDDFVRPSIDRGAAELARVGQRQALAELLSLLAGRSAQFPPGVRCWEEGRTLPACTCHRTTARSAPR